MAPSQGREPGCDQPVDRRTERPDPDAGGGSARPVHWPGRAATTSLGGRWIGVSSPLLLTHTTTPSGASTRSTSAGNRKQLTSTHGADRMHRRAEGARRRRAPDGRGRAARGRSISRATSVASTTPPALGEHRACRRRCRSRARRRRRRTEIVREPTRERVGDHCVALGRRARVPLGGQPVEEGRHLGAGVVVPRRRVKAGGPPGHDPHRVVVDAATGGLVAGDVASRAAGERCRHRALGGEPGAALGGLDAVAEQHRDGGRADPADPRRDPARHLLARARRRRGAACGPRSGRRRPPRRTPGVMCSGWRMPGNAGGGDHDVGPPGVLGPVGHAGVHDGDGRVGGRPLLREQQGERAGPSVVPRPRMHTPRPDTGIS